MEDIQPNEVRLSRKGSTAVPRVRTSRPTAQPFPPSKRLRLHKSETCPLVTPPLATSRKELVKVHLPPECYKGAPGNHKARQTWIQGQKHHLHTHRDLSVVAVEYLERERSVLFICRTGRGARDNVGTPTHPLNAQVDTESVNLARQGLMAPRKLEFFSLAKVSDNHRAPAQSSEAGPSQRPPPDIGPAPRVLPGVCLRRRDSPSSSVPFSGSSVERKPVESPLTAMRSSPVQRIHSSPIPRRHSGMRAAPPKQHVIDLTLNPPSPVTEESSARWSNFRSGTLGVSLSPSSSDSRVTSAEANTGPQPMIGQLPAQTMGHGDDIPVGRSSDASLLLVQSNVQGEVEVPHWPPDYDPRIRGPILACDSLPLSLGPYDRPRRVLHDCGFTYIVTAHGIIDQVRATSTLELDRNIRSPSLPPEELVDDACILSHEGESVIILGHAREQNQLAILTLGRGRVPRHITLRRDWNTAKKPGVSALISLMSPLKFASGGYDRRVHLWDITEDLSGASAIELAIKHTTVVHSLLPIMDTSHKLVSVGADCNVHFYDMAPERVVKTLRMSSIPYHAHKTDSQFCTLLEVAHLEMQFELRDHRMLDRAVQRFGFITEEKHGRFMKGDAWSQFFACGDRNGVVRLWDLRNVSKEVALLPCFSDPVIQVVKTGPRVLACSKKNELACIDFQGG